MQDSEGYLCVQCLEAYTAMQRSLFVWSNRNNFPFTAAVALASIHYQLLDNSTKGKAW